MGALKGFKNFLMQGLHRLPGGHRPPTGPMTTTETADAEESRQQSLAKDTERIEREREDASDRRDPEV